jgi:hypothetical protein
MYYEVISIARSSAAELKCLGCLSTDFRSVSTFFCYELLIIRS